jgi:hypothetical protein
MTSDVAARMHEHISALGRAEQPDTERIEHLYKRTSRLMSLRKQVERLQDELELELLASGDRSALAADLAGARAMRAHLQPPRSLRCQRP